MSWAGGTYDAYGNLDDDDVKAAEEEEENDKLYLQMYMSGQEAPVVIQPLESGSSEDPSDTAADGPRGDGADDASADPESRKSPQLPEASSEDTSVHMVNEKADEIPLESGEAIPAVDDPDLTCFACGQTGHLSYHCSASAEDKARHRLSSVTCYRCNQQGHLSYECQNQSSRARGSTSTSS
eukprot:CAMPEP_0177674032 /NCGR_PEP_ID=MMETSP0447-20121125/26315_1 /TAXON_ID=0 /ORGANISM="Stygamoeba regulata, Strain BSH-02190019" /LENGTH=181 /DNA_ID=CAMNT_0019182053 /DNA_START=120 /DNA_END=663 /DNA_ORIENTATION=+